MSVAIFLAAAVILGGVVVVAMGRGGELARERPQLSAHTDFRTWSDVASYRPPAALLGYHAATTERALTLIARTLAERDAEIEWLRERLAEASPPDAGTASDAGTAPAGGAASAAGAASSGYSAAGPVPAPGGYADPDPATAYDDADPAGAYTGPDTSASPVRAGYPARQDPFGRDPFGQAGEDG